LDRKLVKMIVSGNYTPSPIERKRLAAASVAGTGVHTVMGAGGAPEGVDGGGPALSER